MADRLDFFFKQRVTEAELDEAFELMERSIRAFAADIGVHGIVSGALPTPHAPVADLSIDLTAPARGYDRLGQRVAFGTGQTVDCSVDHQGIATSVPNPGEERWLGVFVKFNRALSDPRTDGNSQEVMFRRDESFQLVVRQAAPGLEGAATKVPLEADELLVCDVRLVHGQSQIENDAIDTERRQAFVFAQSGAVDVDSGGWSTLNPVAPTVQGSFDEVDAELTQHFDGSGRRHSANDIDSTPYGFIEAANLGAAMHEVVDDLGSTESGNSGASLIGTAAITTAPHAIASGTVTGQLTTLAQWHNAHLDSFPAHNASKIAVVDIEGRFTGSNVEQVTAELGYILEREHYRDNEGLGIAGKHRTIHQPAMGDQTQRVLIWHAEGVGAVTGQLRVYADALGIWFVINATWDNAAGEWSRVDTEYHAGGIYLSRKDFVVLHAPSNGLESYFAWPMARQMAMSSAVNSSWLAIGPVHEIGRVAMQITNPLGEPRILTTVCCVTFRARFPGTPSSITLAATDVFGAWSTSPTIYDADRDGFGAYDYPNVAAGQGVWWYGRYLAVA